MDELPIHGGESHGLHTDKDDRQWLDALPQRITDDAVDCAGERLAACERRILALEAGLRSIATIDPAMVAEANSRALLCELIDRAGRVLHARGAR